MDARRMLPSGTTPARFRRMLALAVAAALAAAFGKALDAQSGSQVVTERADPWRLSANDAIALRYRDILDKHERSEQRALRVRLDAERRRLWILGVDRAYVYSAATGALVRRLDLPNWPVAAFVCPPDLALDRAGAAFVSSNVEPRLVRIDPERFSMTEYALELISPRRWEIGFGGLAFGPDGTLFASAAWTDTLWKIDLGRRLAEEIRTTGSPSTDCALAAVPRHRDSGRARFVSICAGKGEARRSLVEVTLEPLAARVTKKRCAD